MVPLELRENGNPLPTRPLIERTNLRKEELTEEESLPKEWLKELNPQSQPRNGHQGFPSK